MQIARELKYVRGSQANLTGLVTAIARREIPLFPSSTLSDEQQEALVQAVLALRSQGAIGATKELAAWCLSQTELLPEYRVQLDGTISPLLQPWIQKVEEFIQQQQPFQLAYVDAANRPWTYTVRYATLSFWEKRSDLECWCEETEGNQDLPELRHNWSLRLDRITEGGIMPITGDWHSALDTVEVEFELFDGLAHAYQQRNMDIAVEWRSLSPPHKRVVRRISNTFWFIREVLPYSKDCVVLHPDFVRQKVRSNWQAAPRAIAIGSDRPWGCASLSPSSSAHLPPNSFISCARLQPLP